MLFRRLYGFKANLFKIITERGGDARNMKPIGIFKYSVPIEIGWRRLTYRMLGQLCYIGAVYTEIGKRNRRLSV